MVSKNKKKKRRYADGGTLKKPYQKKIAVGCGKVMEDRRKVTKYY